MIDPVAESQELTDRSLELVRMLDDNHPVVEGMPTDVVVESERLARAAREAKREVARKVAAGQDPGCVIGHQPPVVRVGRVADPFHGAPVITSALLRYWEFQRDHVAVAEEARYRQAATERPYSEPLVAAAKQHLGLLMTRCSMPTEGGRELENSLRRYDESYLNLRQSANDAGSIATAARDRLASLKRAEAAALMGTDEIKPFIANAIASVADFPMFDPNTGMPLVAVKPATEQPVKKVAG
jgi:hypothetical protein